MRSNSRILVGKYARKSLLIPPSTITRPTTNRVRESIFNVLEHLTSSEITSPTIHGKTVLDAFAGSGGLGLEALSRGAAFCTFVDQNPQAFGILRENLISISNGDECEILRQDILKAPLRHTYDLVFLDPPYGKKLVPPVLQILDEKKYLKPGCIIVIECDVREDLKVDAPFILLVEKKYGDTRVLFLVYPNNT